MSLFLNQLTSSSNKPPLAAIKVIKQLIRDLNDINNDFNVDLEFNPFLNHIIIVNFVTSIFLGLDLIKNVFKPKLKSWFDVYDQYSDPFTLFIELSKQVSTFKDLTITGEIAVIKEEARLELLRGISWAKSAEYLSNEFNWLKNHLDPEEIPFKSITLDIFDQILYILREEEKKYSFSKGAVYTPYFIAKQIAEKLIFSWFDNLDIEISRNKAYNKIKVLDPTVGTGVFLIAAGNVILDNFADKNSKSSSISIKKSILENNLYGIDTDKIVCYITKIKQLLWLIEEQPEVIFHLTKLNLNINAGDSLVGYLQIPEELKRTDFNKEILSDIYHSNFQKKLAIYQLPEHSDFQQIIKLINADFRKFSIIQGFKYFIIEGAIADWNEYKVTLNDNFKSRVNFSLPDSNLDKISRLYVVFTHKITDKEFVKSNSMNLYIFEDAYHWCDQQSPSKFDIIVGNPPFIALTDLPMKMRLKLKILFPNVYTGNNDLSYFFLERMTSLLKLNGILGFILPKYIQTSVYAEKIRTSLIKKNIILELHDFTDFPIFSSTKIKTCFISLKNQNPMNNQAFMYYRYRKDDLKKIKIINFLQSDLKPEKWVILDSKLSNIVKHIQSTSNHKLKDMSMISKGIETGCDKIFAPKEPFFFSRHLKLKSSNYRPWIKGKEIKQFFIEREGREVLYAPKSRQYEIKEDQKIIQYLDPNKKLLLNRSRVTKYYLWRDGDERNTMPWEKNKIVCPFKSKVNTFAIDFKGSLSSKDVTWIIPKKKYSDNDFMYFLLGQLNSNVLIFYAQSIFKDLGYIYDFYPHQIKNFPLRLPKITSSEFKRLVEVTKQLEGNNPSQNRPKLMVELNKLVYHLFNLSEEAINLIELNIMV